MVLAEVGELKASTHRLPKSNLYSARRPRPLPQGLQVTRRFSRRLLGRAPTELAHAPWAQVEWRGGAAGTDVARSILRKSKVHCSADVKRELLVAAQPKGEMAVARGAFSLLLFLA